VLHIFLNLFFVNLKEFTEFVSCDIVIAVFVVSFPDFAHQALCGTKRQPGEIHDIPVPDNQPYWHFVNRHDSKIDA
jgi:hypothetical protein